MPEIKDHYVACVDVGTNSVKLLIADLTAGKALPIFESSAITRLGEGMNPDHRQLLELPMRRTLEALDVMVQTLQQHQVTDIACVGTAALRDADNTAVFVNRARETLGIAVEVISGEEEARLSFLAVRMDPHWRSEPHLHVVDVGGGSTEIIEGMPGTAQIASRRSVNLGAVKLTERYLRSDPPTIAQLEAANSAARSEFRHISGGEMHPSCVVGVGGTLTSLAAMSIGGVKDARKIHGYRLNTEDLEAQIDRLGCLRIAERQSIPGLDPRRADIILGGAMLLSHALAVMSATHIYVSTRGLRWGVLYDRFSYEL